MSSDLIPNTSFHSSNRARSSLDKENEEKTSRVYFSDRFMMCLVHPNAVDKISMHKMTVQELKSAIGVASHRFSDSDVARAVSTVIGRGVDTTVRELPFLLPGDTLYWARVKGEEYIWKNKSISYDFQFWKITFG